MFNFLIRAVLFSLIANGCCFAAPSPQSAIAWETDYNSALKKAKESSRPLLLFFTGSDWCGWCTKLEKEVLQTEEFASLARGQFIFVLIDFPLNKPLDAKLTEQNKTLQKKFEVKGFPTLILLSPEEKVIGSTGYRPGGAKSFAEHLIKMVSDYQGYRSKLSGVSPGHSSTAEIQQLYLLSLEHDDVNAAHTLLSMGLESRDSKGRPPLFFYLKNFQKV